MADEEDQPVTPVAPPPQAVVPRGTGYTYSTPGPGNWQNPQTAAGPGGPVQIPQNAQNFTSIVGPPPEDQETAAFRKMFNSLPMDQAIKAYQAAKQFQGQRVLQSKLAGYSAAGLPPEQALSRAMTDAAAVGLFSTPKEMLDLHKGLSTANADKAKQQFERSKMIQDAITARSKATQQAITERARVRAPGSLSAADKEALKSLDTEEKELRKDLGRTAYWKPAQLTPEGKQEFSTKTNRLAQIVAKKQMLAPEPQLPTETKSTPAKPTGRVRVRSKQGKVGTVPADQVEQAKKAGYTVLE